MAYGNLIMIGICDVELLDAILKKDGRSTASFGVFLRANFLFSGHCDIFVPRSYYRYLRLIYRALVFVFLRSHDELNRIFLF